jgi:hypothetical protein
MPKKLLSLLAQRAHLARLFLAEFTHPQAIVAFTRSGRPIYLMAGADDDGATLTTLEETLKEDVSPSLRDGINTSNPFWTYIDRDWRKTGGKRVRWPIRLALSSGTGWRAEEGATPEAGHSRHEEAIENVKYFYHLFRISGPAMDLSEGDAYSFISGIEQETKDTRDAMRRDVSRVSLLNTSSAGILGTVGANNVGTTIDLSGGTPPSTQKAQMLFFFKGLKIDLYTAAGVYVATRTVQTVNVSAKTIVVDSAVTSTATDTLHRQGSRNNEPTGLPGIVSDTGILHGIDPAVEPDWKAVVVGDYTQTVTEDYIEELYDEHATAGLGNEPALITWSHAQRRKLTTQLRRMKRYDAAVVPLKADFRGLEVGRGIAVADRFHPDNDIFTIELSEMAKFQAREFDFDRSYGNAGGILRSVEGVDSFRARYKGYATIGAYSRRAHGRLKVAA